MGNSELYQLHTVLLAFAKGFCDSFGTEKEKDRKADNLPSVHAFKITPSKKNDQCLVTQKLSVYVFAGLISYCTVQIFQFSHNPL